MNQSILLRPEGESYFNRDIVQCLQQHGNVGESGLLGNCRYFVTTAVQGECEGR